MLQARVVTPGHWVAAQNQAFTGPYLEPCEECGAVLMASKGYSGMSVHQRWHKRLRTEPTVRSTTSTNATTNEGSGPTNDKSVPAQSPRVGGGGGKREKGGVSVASVPLPEVSRGVGDGRACDSCGDALTIVPRGGRRRTCSDVCRKRLSRAYRERMRNG